MKISGIYKIQSELKPERIYIGSAININNRWQSHLKSLRINKHHSKKLQTHFNKYGIADLKFTVLLACDKDDLIKTEQYFLDSYNPYFNICKIAGSTLGFKFSEASKKKLSKASKGNKYCLGRKVSQETRNKISDSKKGKISFAHNEQSKLKLSKAFKDKPLSEETKQKFRDGWEKRRLKLGKPKSKYLIKKYGT